MRLESSYLISTTRQVGCRWQIASDRNKTNPNPSRSESHDQQIVQNRIYRLSRLKYQPAPISYKNIPVCVKTRSHHLWARLTVDDIGFIS
ncbi:unnamed protein product [Calicophoron daubneyi]|uniref:Uncharacterized protein n=1 Tax=Calicophoron daubneyi TaxID=300641 RepID=A0AAV2TQY9_CALDB